MTGREKRKKGRKNHNRRGAVGKAMLALKAHRTKFEDNLGISIRIFFENSLANNRVFHIP